MEFCQQDSQRQYQTVLQPAPLEKWEEYYKRLLSEDENKEEEQENINIIGEEINVQVETIEKVIREC